MSGDNANDNGSRAELLIIFGKLTAFAAILKMVVGNGFGALSEEAEGAWVADIKRYVGTTQPPHSLAPEEIADWNFAKAEAISTVAKIMEGAVDLSARIRAVHSAR
jgi:hypothetical protein